MQDTIVPMVRARRILIVPMLMVTGCATSIPITNTTTTFLGANSERVCGPVAFTASNFRGPVSADPDFVPSLQAMNNYAIANNVRILVTSSFREEDDDLDSAVVAPSAMSNHLVGHAIDMNIEYGTNFGSLCNSTCLGQSESGWPAEVRGFINDIREDPELRWGGDFATPDVVHIDDGLNVDDPEEWSDRYDVLRGSKCEDDSFNANSSTDPSVKFPF